MRRLRVVLVEDNEVFREALEHRPAIEQAAGAA